MCYRRADVAGGTYFFTVNLAERDHTLLTDHVAVLRAALRRVKRRHPFHIDAMVILPDHLHTVWTLPQGDADYPLAKTERRHPSRLNKGEHGIWQRRYWEHLIRDEHDYARHVDYIHYNAVKHGYAYRAADRPYSSLHRYIAAGMLTRDWGADESEEGGPFGER